MSCELPANYCPSHDMYRPCAWCYTDAEEWIREVESSRPVPEPIRIRPAVYHGSLAEEHGMYTLDEDSVRPYCPPELQRFTLHPYGNSTRETLRNVRPSSCTLLPVLVVP